MRKLFSLIAAVLFAGSMMAAEPYTLKFTYMDKTDGDGSAKLSTVEAIFDAASQVYVASVETGTQVYAGRKYAIAEGDTVYSNLKLGSSSAAGELAFTLANPAEMDSIVFNAAMYSATEGGDGFSVNGTQFTLSAGKLVFEKCVLKPTGTVSTIDIVQTKASKGRFFLTSIEVYPKEGGVTPPAPTMNYYVTGNMTNWGPNANYMLTPDNGGLYKGEFTFAANDEFKVTYSDGTTIDNANWFPTGMDNNYKITEAGDYAITFNPAGNVEGWYYGYFTVAKKEVPVVTPISLTQFITDKPDTEVTLKDLTVIFANGKNTYVIDEDGVALVMYDANKTYYDGTLTAGKVLSGQKATYTSYKNQDEIIPTNAVEATDGVAPVPTKLTEKPTDAQVNRYIAYDNVAATLNGKNYYIFSDVQLYGATGSLKPTAEGNYNVEGIYIVYNATAPEIIVTALAEAQGTAIDNTNVDAKAVKFFENGQLIILKNGVYYNAQGAVVR